jgi:predicted acylesterase/phospholipase RssA
MNLPFIKPVYDSLLRGKDLVLSTDLSFLSKTFSYENTFSGYSSQPEFQEQHIRNVEHDDNVRTLEQRRSVGGRGITGEDLSPNVTVLLSDVSNLDKDKYNTNFNPFIDKDLSPIDAEDEDAEYVPFVLKTADKQLSDGIDSVCNTTQEPTKQMPCPTTIRHLVISGGGEMGFSFYSALRESNKSGFWDIKNIESIYCSSVGSIFAVTMALLPHFGWDIYDDFVLKRPWHKVFNVHFGNFANSFHKKGVFTKETMHEIFKPILGAIDMPMNITLKEFYEYTNIDLHIMTTELTQFELVDLSYKTHPDWELLDAVYCSSGLPILFAPHYLGDRIYLDGGFISNYPINKCLEQVENTDEILGFKRKYQNTDESAAPKINSLFDYLFYIMYTMFTKVSELPKSVKNQVEVCNVSPTINFYKMYNTFKSYDERVILLEDGVRTWEEFYKKTYPQNNTNEMMDK